MALIDMSLSWYRMVRRPAAQVWVVALVACGPEVVGGEGGSDGEASSGTAGDPTRGEPPAGSQGASDGEGGDTDDSATSTGGPDGGTEGSQDTAAGTVPACEQPRNIVGEGWSSGFWECSDGSIDRTGSSSCAVPSSGGQACEPFTGGDCETDADCTAAPHGRCIIFDDDALTRCGCTYDCETDADCGDGQICRCAGVGPRGSAQTNQCIPAACTQPSDCESGRCGFSAFGTGVTTTVWYWAVACRTPEDTCTVDADCSENESCVICPGEYRWTCKSWFDGTC